MPHATQPPSLHTPACFANGLGLPLRATCAVLLAAVLCTACTAPVSKNSTPASGASVPAGKAAGVGGAASTAGPTSATIPPGPTSAPFFERPSAGGAALREGVSAFQMGEYRRAETKLAESFKLGLSNTPDILRGYKTQAFVYCVTIRTAQCEKSFEAAFAVDKKFDLTAAERQHPVWGPVFARVQKRSVS